MSDLLPAIFTAIHAIGAVVWVGGMAFAHMVLRPSLLDSQPPERLAIWVKVFGRFFPLVWVSIVALLATGYHIVFAEFHGFDQTGVYIHVMHGIGLVMVALFVFMFFVPYQRLKAFVAGQDWKDAAGQLALIRRVVTINLILGLITVAVGSSGRFWG